MKKSTTVPVSLVAIVASLLIGTMAMSCANPVDSSGSTGSTNNSPTAPAATATPAPKVLGFSDFTALPTTGAIVTKVPATAPADFIDSISLVDSDNPTSGGTKATISYPLTASYASGKIELDFYVVKDASTDPVSGVVCDVDGAGTKKSSTVYFSVNNANGGTPQRLYECKVDASSGTFKGRSVADSSSSGYVGSTNPILWDGWYHLVMTWDGTQSTYTLSGSGANGAYTFSSASAMSTSSSAVTVNWPRIAAPSDTVPATFTIASGDSATKSIVYVKNTVISSYAALPAAPSPSPAASASPSPSPSPSPLPMPVGTGTVHVVTSAANWTTAMSSLQAGDVVEFSGSIASNFSMSGKVASAANPVVLRAAAGGATIGSLTISNCDYIKVQGLGFNNITANTKIKLVNAKHIDILKNSFDHASQTTKQQSVLSTGLSDDIEIGYNSFKNLDQLTDSAGKVSAHFVNAEVDESGTGITTNMHIHHNLFQNVKGTLDLATPDLTDYLGDSDRETIIFGDSSSQTWETNNIIEHNLFIDCDGENEMVSFKTSKNIFRYNTVQNCFGGLTIRFGHASEAYGNYFLGDGSSANYETGGIRIYGIDHKVYNNHFQGLTGGSSLMRMPIILDAGDTTGTSGDSHQRPAGVYVVNNTIVDCAKGLGIGVTTTYSIQPAGNTIANNLIVDSLGTPLVFVADVTKKAQAETNNTYSANMVYVNSKTDNTTTELGTNLFGAALSQANPLLASDTLGIYSVKLPAAGSPVINAGSAYTSFLTDDIIGTSRSGGTDIGAFEQGTTSGRIPLAATNVGPAAAPF